jgi:protein pelota
MKQIALNLKKGIAKIRIENLDDLWYLSHIIDPDDLVKSKTVRKVRIGEKTDKARVEKKQVLVKIKVEKTEFSKTSDVLRIQGIIEEEHEDIPRGSHQSISAEIGSILTIEKKKWLKYQSDKLKEAVLSKIPKIIICVFDREEAYFALMKKYGYEMLSKMKGDVQKKAMDEKHKGGFYEQITKQIEEYDKRYNPQTFILASPAFWKEELIKHIKGDLKKKVILATCSSVGKNGVDEVLKRTETQEALKQDRIANELNLVEELLAQISKDGLAVYGIKEAEKAANAGAIEKLLVTDTLIFKSRENKTYEKIDSIMKVVDSTKGEIHIVSTEHEGGKKLDGIGGIAGILRYKLSY